MMAALRRRLRAWLSARYPRMVLAHFDEATCLGRELEARFGDNGEIERLRRAPRRWSSTETDAPSSSRSAPPAA